jgi:hypothetical protein
LLHPGIQVIAAYEDDDDNIVVCVSISDVKSLQHFFGLMMIDGIDDKLNEQLNLFASIPGTNSLSSAGSNIAEVIKLQINPTMFAECFERAMSRLENLTSHQMQVYKECSKHKEVHLLGPAGCGKTYLAVHMIRENMKSDDPKQVIFITKNESLCLHIIQLLTERGRDIQMIIRLKKYLYVTYISDIVASDGANQDMSKRLKSFQIRNQEIQFVDTAKGNAVLDSCIVIVDEAHHWFEVEVEVEDVFLFGMVKQSLLRSIVDNYPGSKLMLLSDKSQSTLESIDEINKEFGTISIFLKEVVRSSENIMIGSKCYAVAHTDMTSQHKFQGFPLKTFLYSPTPQMSEKEIINNSIVQLEKALNFLIVKKFQGMSVNGRLAILVPNKACLEAHRDKVIEALNKLNIEAITAIKSTNKTFDSSNDKQQVVVDTIDNFDGLERLIVIGLAFDESGGDNVARSGCYRLITRAQMLLVLAGAVVEGGLFEWLKNMKYDSNTQDKGLNIDFSAAQKCLRKHRKPTPKEPSRTPSTTFSSNILTSATDIVASPVIACCPRNHPLRSDRKKSVFCSGCGEMTSFKDDDDILFCSDCNFQLCKTCAKLSSHIKPSRPLIHLVETDNDIGIHGNQKIDQGNRKKVRPVEKKNVREVKTVVWDTSDNDLISNIDPPIFMPIHFRVICLIHKHEHQYNFT